jgi:hypothetical protein
VVHLQENGYQVDARNVSGWDELGQIRHDHGIPEEASGCHTAVVAGYTVEGHVPADIIDRLIAERPDIVGVTVPGMPEGSPGMEGPNPVPYNIWSVDRSGQLRVYDSR